MKSLQKRSRSRIGSRSLLVVTALASLFGSSASAASVSDLGGLSPAEEDDIRRGLAHVKRNRAAFSRRIPLVVVETMQSDLDEGSFDRWVASPGVEVEIASGVTVTLQSDYIRIAELGAALYELEQRDNLERLYERAYGAVTPTVRAQMTPPSKLAGRSTAFVQSNLERMVDEGLGDFSTMSFGTLSPPTVSRCEAELGYDTGGDGAAGTCTSYAPAGIMKNVDFDLRDDLTCVRDQAERGTCSAFATAAALETGVHVLNGNKINLSEQHGYWYGETHVDAGLGRYTYGVNLVEFVTQIEDDGYQFPKEKAWNYNPSPNIADDPTPAPQFPGAVEYLGSCDGYDETCFDWAFQGPELMISWGVPFHQDPAPDRGARGIAQTTQLGIDAWGLELAKKYLVDEVPLVTAIDVTASFRSPDSNGYVTYVANESVDGGHALHLAGWVANTSLPVGAPFGSGGGYFVAKNSWGEGAGDCGYYYLPYDYVLAYGRSLTALEVD